jgi:hypothetical protein
MKKVLLSAILMATSLGSFAQTKTYAFTSENKGEFTWTALREMNFATGEFTKTLYTKTPKQNFALRGANGSVVNEQSFITGNGVAAAAYDAKSNKLFFTEMYGNTLKFVDLKNSTTTTISTGECFDARFNTGAKSYDQSNVITRMAMGNDGFGYALTNDAKTFLKFSTGENPVVSNLGALRDSKKNSNISIHNQCTCWGGDMIGDIYGNLYLVTMRNNVFKINIANLEAEFIGTIKNLPANFTTNGAAADDDGNILLSSASNADSYFKVNASTLEATAIKAGKDLYNVSDLANANFVYQRSATKSNEVVANSFTGEVSVYPNPAVGKNFNIALNKLEAGNYNISITDVNGKTVLTKQVNITGASLEKMNMPKATSAGMYLIRLTNSEGKLVSTQKLMIN